ncbi:MAG: hypothetical protein LBI05_06290 [Planctomycetaceae bacterium]|jgi:hypothetical protein|nr:hypothetical protein [Planctomycetaceae bacterium]
MKKTIYFPLILIAFLMFSWGSTRSFGQSTLGNTADPFSSMDSLPPPQLAATSEPAQTSFAPQTYQENVPAATTANLNVDDFLATPKQPETPAPAAATANPVTASQFSPIQSPVQSSYSVEHQRPAYQQTPREMVSAVNADHPFRQYWGMPNDPQAKITGKPMTVAELFANTRSSAVRCQLLQAYWELSGLLAVYHFRCETERLATGAGAQQDGTMTLLREQRRTAELEFIKQQWVLAELLKQCKGRSPREMELPIPADFPLYPRYQTFADKIARSERTQYLGRMIPIQEQLIESKNDTWKAASGMASSASQPFFVVSSQRTTAFLDLTQAIIEYNKMIAEYALETIPPNVSQRQLVGAVVRTSNVTVSPVQSQVSPMATSQMATEGITLSQYNAPVGITAEPVAMVAYEYQTPANSTIPTEQSESVPSESAQEWDGEINLPGIEMLLPSVPSVMQDI